jgi:hypothetical protein
MGHTKCFVADAASDQHVVGSYDIQEGAFMHIEIVSPPQESGEVGKVLQSKKVEGKGRFAFLASEGSGLYKACVEMDQLNHDNVKWESSPDGPQLSIKMEVGGAEAVDFEEVAKKEHLDSVTVEIRKMKEIVKTLRENENYMKNREEAARNKSEAANASVQWWSIGQILVLVCTSYWQMSHLKSFFQKKKLI